LIAAALYISGGKQLEKILLRAHSGRGQIECAFAPSHLDLIWPSTSPYFTHVSIECGHLGLNELQAVHWIGRGASPFR